MSEERAEQKQTTASAVSKRRIASTRHIPPIANAEPMEINASEMRQVGLWE